MIYVRILSVYEESTSVSRSGNASAWDNAVDLLEVVPEKIRLDCSISAEPPPHSLIQFPQLQTELATNSGIGPLLDRSTNDDHAQLLRQIDLPQTPQQSSYSYS